MKLYEKDLYFVRDQLWRQSIIDGYNAVIICGLHDYIKNNEITSFMFGIPYHLKPNFQRMSHLADYRVGHSGASYGTTMRIVERIIKDGFHKWKIDYIIANRGDIVDTIVLLQKHIRRALSDPKYMLCKRRLMYEYEFELFI